MLWKFKILLLFCTGTKPGLWPQWETRHLGMLNNEQMKIYGSVEM